MRLAAFMLLSIAIATSSQAQSKSQPPPEITVSATARVTAEPDVAEFSIGIVTRNEQATTAFRIYLGRYRSLKKSLAGIVDSTKLVTDNLSVRPYFNYKKPENTSPEYYQVDASMSLSVSISRLNRVLGAITSVEGVTVNGIQFRVSDQSKLEIEALKLAGRRAREKAEAIAALENLARLSVKSVNTSTTPPPIMPMGRMMSVESVAPSISPAAVEVSATVNAVYTAEQK